MGAIDFAKVLYIFLFFARESKDNPAMDSSSDSYLHKKFKKQQCSISTNDKSSNGGKASPKEKENQKDANAKTPPLDAKQGQEKPREEQQCSSVSVPTTTQQSTNSSLKDEITTLLSSPTSAPIVYSFVKSSISDVTTSVVSVESNGRISWNGEHLHHRPLQSENQQFVATATSFSSSNKDDNSCISYVISNPDTSTNSSRVADVTKFTSNSREPNFDNIKSFNNAYDLTTSATSSILVENSYPNHHHHHHNQQYHYLGGRGEEISTITSQDQDQLIQDQNQKNDITEKISDGGIPDKSSGGKYVCTYCNLVCSKPSVLQKHIRAHTNERPFPCVSCGFSFKTRSNLYKHCRSRTHANRVMGNKAQEITNDGDVEKSEMSSQNSDVSMEEFRDSSNKMQDVKQKPYKPRFKAVLDSPLVEIAEAKQVDPPKTNSDLLSLRIDELIHKNNSIVLVGSNDQYMFKKRSVENNYMDSNHHDQYRYKEPYSPSNIIIDHRNEDEPLNLTLTKNRKRSMSEVAEPTVQKSLIKELLLKNLYADSNKQCPHCKMIFQTVTELDLHKLRSCKGYSKSGARYSRSSSVNVASILTQNKNAFDTNPHIPAVFPLKSPGPFLGKTRLVESDKSKSFSFDDSIQTTTFQSSFSNTHDLIKTRYSLSPLTLPNDRSKKPPVKMFGGEVKITHTSGETKSFKIDGKDERYERSYGEYGGNLSENRVVKSTLQSGGTVLHNKSGNYNKSDPKRSSPDVIRVYENTSVSPSIDMIKTKFNFSRPEVIVDHSKSAETTAVPMEAISSPSYKYTNIMDYSQNAIKQFTPKLKQPNLSIPGIPMPTKIVLPPQRAPLYIDTKSDKPTDSWQKSDHANISPMPAFPKDLDADRRNSENIDFAQKQILLQQKMTSEPPKLQVPYNPMNVLVNGKIIRYVPGIPGPISADPPLEMAYSSNIAAISPRSSSTLANHLPKPNIKITHLEPKMAESYSPKGFQDRPQIESNRSPKLQNALAVKTDCNAREMRSPKMAEMKSPKMSEMKSPKSAESKSPVIKSPNLPLSSGETPKKFARPNSLAIKPMAAGSKQHHGLTPTIFNQILISPDTPRVAKKYNHQILHGNYFSYLGLKSSTKPTYCTLNKTQPFYVPHFKKLSMYSEWTQRDTKTDKLFLSAYDSRQRQQKYTTSGKAKADLIIHSSYKFTVAEANANAEEPAKNILGGYESNDDYTYVRGRGRGRYVCDQCGIRCKKPSMLKKHIRTHSNDRPYTCSHCNFSFKTKGNLTKHMKSKAHTKNYAAYSSGSSNSSAQQSGTPTSESDTDDSGMDSSDESSTRHQEREAVFGLLSLSQKPAVSENRNSSPNHSTPNGNQSLNIDPLSSFMDTEQIAHMTKTNYAKNKILDQAVNFNTAKLSEMSFNMNTSSQEKQKLSQFLGKSNRNRPLTYPYTNDSLHDSPTHVSSKEVTDTVNNPTETVTINEKVGDPIKHFSVVKKYVKYHSSYEKSAYKPVEDDNQPILQKQQVYERNKVDDFDSRLRQSVPSIQIVDSPQNIASDLRKRKGSLDHDIASKIHKSDSEVMDLSISSNAAKTQQSEIIPNGFIHNEDREVHENPNITTPSDIKKGKEISNMIMQMTGNERGMSVKDANPIFSNSTEDTRQHHNENTSNLAYENDQNSLKNTETPMEVTETTIHININYVIQDQPNASVDQVNFKQMDYDNSAMETLADIATKQEKLEKNSIAKNVASEFLKLAIKNESQNSDGLKDANFISSTKDVNELIGKPEENKSCTICSKSFCKPSQLKLHMNIHYLERPYRCDSCSVSFRTKGHLQKHERSAGHHNKLSSSPNLSSSEPRPFKCSDCNIAFRIHGHLAKHLRAKMHIMKLECLNKIPFGLYAELERSNSLLTEINTTDGDQCLESLKMLAKKVFTNDPSKLNHLGPSSTESIDTDS